MQIESVEDIDTIAVVGSGEMGRGIAGVAALAGYRTRLYDIDEDQLEAAIEHIKWSLSKTAERGGISEWEVEAGLARITTTNEMTEAVADIDFVTEAGPEQQAVKKDIFQSLNELAPPHAILATNTSGLNITKLAEATDRPDQVVGTHWFNPPMLMDLVEVIMTEYTPEGVADVCESLVESFGKTPIRCRRDVPKFIVNRLMRPYGEAASWLVYFGDAEIVEIDSAMKYREGFPMGPFELADFTGGIQLRVEGEEDLLQDDRPLSYDTRMCPLLHEFYEKGHYGRKTGKGYYDYTEQDSPDIPEDAGEDFDTMLVWAPVINEGAKMVQHDIASVKAIDTGARLGGNWPASPLEKADELGLETVVRKCVDAASRHERIENLAENLPCDLLVEKAKAGETFY